MRNLIFIVVLVTVLMGSFVSSSAAKGKTQASDTVEVRVIIEDYAEVRFDRGDEGETPDLEIRLRNKLGAKGFGKKDVWVAANFTHNVVTLVIDQPNDGVLIEKASGTTADRTDVAPGGKKYNVRVQATLENFELIPSANFIAGTVTVTVTKGF